MSIEILINNRFTINKKVGKGSFGDVHLGHDKLTGNLVAIKLEHRDAKLMLKHEFDVYNEIWSSDHKIPRIYWYGNEGEFRVMVMEYLGESLESLFNRCHRKFSLKTVLMIGIQMFDLIEHLHRKNYVHRDLKPDNFLIGINDKRFYVHMIDYGLAKRYKNKQNVHTKFVNGKKLVGTARYASINSHQGIELSRRDDLESLMYILIYFLKGSLPWQGLPGTTREQKYEAIKRHKIKTSMRALCGGVPEQFYHFLYYTRNLSFKDKPNYKYLRSLLFGCLEQNNFKFDFKYDWVKLR